MIILLYQQKYGKILEFSANFTLYSCHKAESSNIFLKSTKSYMFIKDSGNIF